MRVLIACEYSGSVRSAFERAGHFAMSCDLLPTEIPGRHYQGDVRDILDDNWDLMVAHPPCTHLAVSGARWWYDKPFRLQAEALQLVDDLLNAPIQHIALENPIGLISSMIRKPDQVIQPWMFGHGETKATCLWLKNLPLLQPTDIVEGRHGAVWRMPPSPDRWKLRSATYQGIADAMGQQWGNGLVGLKPLATTALGVSALPNPKSKAEGRISPDPSTPTARTNQADKPNSGANP